MVLMDPAARSDVLDAARKRIQEAARNAWSEAPARTGPYCEVTNTYFVYGQLDPRGRLQIDQRRANRGHTTRQPRCQEEPQPAVHKSFRMHTPYNDLFLPFTERPNHRATPRRPAVSSGPSNSRLCNMWKTQCSHRPASRRRELQRSPTSATYRQHLHPQSRARKPISAHRQNALPAILRKSLDSSSLGQTHRV